MKYEKLEQAGVDVESLRKRLMGNDALLPVLIRKFSQDTNFEKLQSALEREDMKGAEMASHTLKGMCGNLSLDRLYPLFTAQVELLRKGEHRRARGMMAEISDAYRNALLYMGEWLQET